MTILYKKDSKGKIREIRFSTEENILVQEAGLLNGKLVRNERVCTEKNQGRANATTAEEQAILEMESKITQKLKEAYFKTIEEAEETKVIMPMLAKTADLRKISYPVLVQPKLDGMRMVSTSAAKLSRKNTPIETLAHIETSWIGDHILDGEVYAHGRTFQENMRLIKKYRQGETEEVQYHVYDMPSIDASFKERHDTLKAFIGERDGIVLVEAYEAQNEVEVMAYHAQFIDEGYEGTMIRLLDDTSYEFNKRSKSLLKLKDFIDEAYEIVDVVASEKRPSEGVVVCKMPNGSIFRCGMKLSLKERETFLIEGDEHIGKMAEVRFFEFSDDGIPRFPVYHGTRLDK
ncbi:MAG: Unknown protein [uncultured Sulfurovum sp.]|uniref:Polydeoxyribonucleotide synthase [ATP] n=1 Tax=uncultured Sulfurovum sp. TaxID=269237 RepID=A0A6S6SKG7_9BACT|nr:MAG: Unknown protein [uncultured Sulfurovum sp.]